MKFRRKRIWFIYKFFFYSSILLIAVGFMFPLFFDIGQFQFFFSLISGLAIAALIAMAGNEIYEIEVDDGIFVRKLFREKLKPSEITVGRSVTIECLNGKKIELDHFENFEELKDLAVVHAEHSGAVLKRDP